MLIMKNLRVLLLALLLFLAAAQVNRNRQEEAHHNNSAPAPVPQIYMRRMRKAGSTTIQYFIRDALRIRMEWLSGVTEKDSKQEALAKFKRAKAERRVVERIQINRIEYASLNSACALNSASPDIVLVTHFREPLARHYSEVRRKQTPSA